MSALTYTGAWPAPHPRGAPVLIALATAAVLAGGLAAAGYGLEAVAATAALGLVALGAAIPLDVTRGVLLAALLLVPDQPSGQSLGFLVHWSAGLTWSNFVLPALGAPLLLGAWLAGHRLTPPRWPALARWCLALLAWCLLTLLVPWSAGGLPPAAAATVLAHLAKLALFLWLGVVLVGTGAAWHRRAGVWLAIAIAVNAVVGLGQALGWLPVFSPLAQASAGLGARASGLFYDANMYGVLAAWALLWLLTRPGAEGKAPAWWWLLTLAVGGSLVAAGSRAGYGALLVGLGVLGLCGRWRPAARAAVLLGGLGLLFPVRSWQRIAAATTTLQADWGAGATTAGADAGTQQRLASMQQALLQIARHPLLGLGFGRSLYVGVAAVGSGPVASSASFQGAQSMGLTVLAETGPVGLGLFLIAVAAPLRRLRAAARSHDERQLVLLAGFAGLLAACLTIEALWNTRVLALAVLLTSGAALGARPAPPSWSEAEA